MRGALSLVAGTILAGSALAGSGQQGKEGAPTEPARSQWLVGEWKLNPELSEDAREKMRQAIEQSRRGGGMGRYPGGPGGMGHPGGGGMGGYPGGGPGGRGGPERGPGRDGVGPPNLSLLNATELTIANVSPEVSIIEPGGFVRNLRPDGQKHESPSGGEVRASWDRGRLRVETKLERGSVKESWSVDEQSRRLTVELEVQQGGLAPVKVKRVFDRVEGSARAPE